MSGVAVVELEQKAEVLVAEAKALKIVDQATYNLAAERLLGVAALRHEIIEHHKTMKSSAYAAWQHVIAAEKRLLNPAAEAERLYKASLAMYESEQRHREEESRRAAEAEARRAAEEQRESELQRAEMEGATGAEIAAMINEPLMVALPRLQPAFQAARGITTAVNWKGEVTSLEMLVRSIAAGQASISLVMPNQTSINALAKATHNTLTIPGLRFFTEPIVRAQRR
jgi:hypothetical protein